MCTSCSSIFPGICICPASASPLFHGLPSALAPLGVLTASTAAPLVVIGIGSRCSLSPQVQMQTVNGLHLATASVYMQNPHRHNEVAT